MLRPSARVLAYWLLWLLLVPLSFVLSQTAGELAANESSVVAYQDPACPGEQTQVLITGVSESGVPSPEAMVRGEPLTGRSFEPHARSYWHCHGGGQYLVVMEGVGRVQKRGERARDLHVGEIEFAAPGVEHWHGGSPTTAARYINQNLAIGDGSGTYWMEEVTPDDYLGNDDGIASRRRFLETGER